MFIIDPDRLVNGVMEVMRRKLMVIVPKAWVICSCPATRSAAKRAMCRKQEGHGTARAVGPDFSKAGSTVCPSCIWAIENEVTRSFARQELRDLKVACSQPRLQGTVLGELQEAKVLAFVDFEKEA